MPNKQYHNFDIDDAAEYGLIEAILLANIKYWVGYNEEHNKNYYDGSYWTFNSYEKYTQVFTYLSKKQIRRALESLKKQGAVITGNYNKKGYDRTLWYSLPCDLKGSTISPVGLTNTIVKPIIKQDHEINNDNRCSLMYEDTEENNINFVDKMR